MPRYNLQLSLPPSENQRLIKNKYTGQLILSQKARDWLEMASKEIWVFVKNHHLKPIERYTHIDLYFTLKRSNQDSHNFLKLLGDALEKGGLVKNDKYVMFRIQNVENNPKNPGVDIYFNSL